MAMYEDDVTYLDSEEIASILTHSINKIPEPSETWLGYITSPEMTPAIKAIANGFIGGGGLYVMVTGRHTGVPFFYEWDDEDIAVVRAALKELLESGR